MRSAGSTVVLNATELGVPGQGVVAAEHTLETPGSPISVIWQTSQKDRDTAGYAPTIPPVVRITAQVGLSRITYDFDAAGGSWCMCCDRVSVEVRWRNSMILYGAPNTLYNEYSVTGTTSDVPKGKWTVNVGVSEGECERDAAYTQYLPNNAGALPGFVQFDIPHWASEVLCIDQSAAGYKHPAGGDVHFYEGAISQGLVPGVEVYRVLAADLDTLQQFGAGLPIVGSALRVDAWSTGGLRTDGAFCIFTP